MIYGKYMKILNDDSFQKGNFVQVNLDNMSVKQYNSLLQMGKQTKNEALGRVYREFSRQKYNKYKAQFPKLRQSQIVTKIIKEWDALDMAGKEHLRKIYEEKKFLTNEDISSSEALRNAERADKEARAAAEQSAKAAARSLTEPRTGTVMHSNIRTLEKDQSDYNRASQARDESRLVESSSPAVVVKTKTIAKASQSDYITFFKTYYRSLSKEHPRWTTQQISSVIKLLWRKRKGKGKSLRRTDGKLRTSKPLSGRRYFRKVKNLDGQEAKIKWRLLPIECRIYWKHQSEGVEVDNRRVPGTVSFRPTGVRALSSNTFSFLSKIAV